MKQPEQILYVTDIAKRLGRTEAAVRMGVARGVAWMPKPFRLGSRIAWRAAEVDKFIADAAEK